MKIVILLCYQPLCVYNYLKPFITNHNINQNEQLCMLQLIGEFTVFHIYLSHASPSSYFT